MIWNIIKKLRVIIIYKILKLETKGVRVMLIDKNKILLIKHPYDNFWVLPGGGIKRNESVIVAAKRELLEETGYVPKDSGNILGIYHNTSGGKNDYVTVCVFNGYSNYIKTKSIEVQKNKWFDIKNLPNVSTATEKRMREYVRNQYSDEIRLW